MKISKNLNKQRKKKMIKHKIKKSKWRVKKVKRKHKNDQ